MFEQSKVVAPWHERNRCVLTIGAATAFSLLGDQVLYAVLPVYYESLGISALQVGVLLSANRWIRLITNDWAHRLGQRRGQKWLFLLAFVLGVLTTAAYALYTTFSVLLVMRLAWGLAWSFIRHLGVQAILLDVPGERAGRTMGLYNGISRAGSVAGLLGGALLVDIFGFVNGILCLAIISLVSLPLAWSGHRGYRLLESRQSGSALGLAGRWIRSWHRGSRLRHEHTRGGARGLCQCRRLAERGNFDRRAAGRALRDGRRRGAMVG